MNVWELGFAFALPQEASQSLTKECRIPSPRSGEAMLA
jgi:hypothetical protein